MNYPFKIGQPRFLTLDEILTLHAASMDAYGRVHGLVDSGKLEASLEMPQRGFGGTYAHEFPFGMAAAYGYHIAMNRAFRDGNKRVAFMAMGVFLRLNGWNVLVQDSEAADLVLEMIEQHRDKEWLAARLKQQSRIRVSLELRDFLSRVRLSQMSKVAESICAANSIMEVRATEAEAYSAIPLLEDLDDVIEAHRESGNDHAVQSLWHQQLFMITLFRLAEDMGYEW